MRAPSITNVSQSLVHPLTLFHGAHLCVAFAQLPGQWAPPILHGTSWMRRNHSQGVPRWGLAYSLPFIHVVASLMPAQGPQNRPHINQCAREQSMARILIEDDADSRIALRRILERAGHTVLEATDGQEGIERYRTTPTELVITDILMPEREGLETIMALRREFPDVKIIAVSGGIGPLDFLHVAARFGAQRTFAKPFDYRELLDAVQELVS